MKKSLSVLVAGAMVSSMFASVAFAADLTTEQKLQALINAGIFDPEGTGNGFELDAKMTREQLAKILAKLMGLQELPGTSYTDVEADRWSAGFIQAVSKANPPLMDGQWEGIFNPSGTVTIEELATVAVRALNLEVKNNAEVDGEVSDWAKGYVAAAVSAGLIGELSDYTKPAIRSQLVEATYAAKEALDDAKNPKVSVVSAKAVGVQKVEVTFSKAVDTEKAKLSLKKGTVDIALNAPTWSQDGKTATVTLKDAKISEGQYTVTLSGVENIDKNSASFVGENEKVTKLEFATASDEIAKSSKARVQFRAVNQYGEPTSMSAGNFTVTTPNFNSSVTKDNNGNYVVTIDTANPISGTANTGTTIIPVYIYENDSRVSVQKNFRLGAEPFVTKMELGQVKYPAGKSSISASGEYATIPVILYDQYGNPMAFDNPGVNADKDGNWVYNTFTTPYNQNIKPVFGDFDGDNFGEVRVPLNGRVEKSEDYTITVQIGGANASTKVSVSSVKLVTKIEFGEPSDTLNVGEVKDVYIPIIGYDENGNRLTADELVDDENYKRIIVNASAVKGVNGGAVKIEKTGPYKGQLHVTEVDATAQAGSYAFFSAYLDSKMGNTSYITKTVPILKARVPDKVSVVTNNAPKTAGGASSYKMVILDQNGKQLNKLPTVDENGRTVTYEVYVQFIGTNGEGGDVNDLYVERLDRLGKASGVVFYPGDTVTFTGDLNDFNSTYQFKVNDKGTGKNEKLEVKATLRKIVDGNKTDISTATRSITFIDVANENLTYTVSKPSAMYAVKDSALLSQESQFKTGSLMGRSITVSAKDSAGDTVALPNSGIFSVTSSAYSIAQADTNGSGTGRVIGYTPGEATLTVAYKTLKGETRTANVDVTVKGDIPTISRVTSDANVTLTSADRYNKTAVYDEAWEFMNLAVVDSYGVSYKEANIYNYRNITGVIYTIDTDIPKRLRIDATTGVLYSKDADGNEVQGLGNLDAGTYYFTLTATSGSHSTSTYVKYTKQ